MFGCWNAKWYFLDPVFCSKSELLTWKAMFLPPRGLLWRRWQSLKLHYHIHAAAMLPHFIYKTGLFCILENVSWWMFRSDSAILDYLNKTQVSTSFGAKPPWQKSKLHFISNAPPIYIVNQNWIIIFMPPQCFRTSFQKQVCYVCFKLYTNGCTIFIFHAIATLYHIIAKSRRTKIFSCVTQRNNIPKCTWFQNQA